MRGALHPASGTIDTLSTPYLPLAEGWSRPVRAERSQLPIGSRLYTIPDIQSW